MTLLLRTTITHTCPIYDCPAMPHLYTKSAWARSVIWWRSSSQSGPNFMCQGKVFWRSLKAATDTSEKSGDFLKKDGTRSFSICGDKSLCIFWWPLLPSSFPPNHLCPHPLGWRCPGETHWSQSSVNGKYHSMLGVGYSLWNRPIQDPTWTAVKFGVQCRLSSCCTLSLLGLSSSSWPHHVISLTGSTCHAWQRQSWLMGCLHHQQLNMFLDFT